MTALSVGVIGIGAFGSRVALRLLWNGWHALQLYDVNDISTRQFTNDYGAMTTGSPKMMAQACDVVVTALPSAAELREVCFGWESLAKGFAPGGIVVDLGTTDPLETAAIGRELAARGVDLVDAPAFGTPADAKEGKLTLIVGGEDRAVERCRPVLQTLAHNLLRAGAPGSAQAASAIVDYVRGAELLVTSEALRLGERIGLPPEALLHLADTLGHRDLHETLRRQVLTRRFGSGHALGLVHRNLALASRLAGEVTVATPMLEATLAAWTKAETKLGSGADHTAIIRWLETLTTESAGAPPSDAPAAPRA
ncbi:MAG: NAD(P)-dependent oxidoreductase [Hyphomicrobiales bacterium]|nr:NAD(P)-dependent oxidoreductase [Hyphomicrobiales bacterium]